MCNVPLFFFFTSFLNYSLCSFDSNVQQVSVFAAAGTDGGAAAATDTEAFSRKNFHQMF